MMEFIRGIRTPLLTTSSPASASTASKACVNLESVCHEHGEELDVGRAT
jgi:hypothetical protein